MPMMFSPLHSRPARSFLVVLAAVIVVAPARSQEIPRDGYFVQLPPGLPSLFPANDASLELGLWGDASRPGYVDVDPRDGIDDRRNSVLSALAARFGPILVQNTGDFPMDFRVFMENRDTFPLFVDLWETFGEEPEHQGTQAVNFAALGRCDRDSVDRLLEANPLPSTDPALEDCKLLDLLDRYSPGSGRTRAVDDALVRSRQGTESVLFFNFPGTGADDWKGSYWPEMDRTPEARRASVPHAFVHPFVHEIEAEDGGGYELVLQYWFFYPTNDSGMDHEGDWEHMNVVVTPLSALQRGLTAFEIRAILEGEGSDDGADPLVMKRVDFYFHHSVFPLDFAVPNAYAPRDAWEAEVDELPQERFRVVELWRSARELAWADDEETIINTHPLGYIGGDNKGLNQALEMPGGSNRDPHGTYPFPGRYTGVGPGGTTDHLTAHIDFREYLAQRSEGRGDPGPGRRYEGVLALADEERLTLVPDWERLVEPILDEADTRRRWAWLILPVRWGYPATSSPFAGALENYDTGNVAPQGPSYNPGWNVTGAGPGFSSYDPHILPPVLPISVQDAFRNDLGFLNLTVPLLLTLPPLDFISRVVAFPFRTLLGRGDPVYYPNETVPYRFVGVSSGLSVQWFSDEFQALALNPAHFERWVTGFVSYITENLEGIEGAIEGAETSQVTKSAVGTFIQVPFYIGSRFTSENTFRHTRSEIGLGISFPTAPQVPDYFYRSDVDYWEYAGSLRYTVLQLGPLEPFAKVGYGWSWYRLENARDSNGTFDPPESARINPGFWPNVLHFGAGVEWIPRKRVGELPGGLDLAFRIEYNRYSERLNLEFDQIPLGDLALLFPSLADLPTGRAHRDELLFGVSLSF